MISLQAFPLCFEGVYQKSWADLSPQNYTHRHGWRIFDFEFELLPVPHRSSAAPIADKLNTQASHRGNEPSCDWQSISAGIPIRLKQTYRHGPHACRVRLRETL
jgi:hypothetical protein